MNLSNFKKFNLNKIQIHVMSNYCCSGISDVSFYYLCTPQKTNTISIVFIFFKNILPFIELIIRNILKQLSGSNFQHNKD